MNDHISSVTAVSRRLGRKPEDVEKIVAAYLDLMMESGWSIVRGQSRIRRPASGMVTIEDMRDTEEPHR